MLLHKDDSFQKYSLAIDSHACCYANQLFINHKQVQVFQHQTTSRIKTWSFLIKNKALRDQFSIKMETNLEKGTNFLNFIIYWEAFRKKYNFFFSSTKSLFIYSYFKEIFIQSLLFSVHRCYRTSSIKPPQK